MSDSSDIFSDISSPESPEPIGKDAVKVLDDLKQEVEAFVPEVKSKLLPVKRTIADVEAEVKEANAEAEMHKAMRKREHYASLVRLVRNRQASRP
jgi:hypothetical protein